MDNGIFTNYVLSLLLKKTVIPGDFHERCETVRNMQEDDISGLVDSMTDFAINSASVDYSFETENSNLTNILNNWLETVNIEYNGQVPSGINALAKEYFKERWKYSSFPILKVQKWKRVNDMVLPTKMYFVDGESVYAEDKTGSEDDNIELLNYDYFIGKSKKNKIQDTVNSSYIITKPFSRWFDKYPTPYLIKRGIYHNWKIIESLKNKEMEILNQILPYLLLIKEGSPELFKQGKTISQPELDNVIEQFQDLMDEIKTAKLGDSQIKTPMRASNFSEEIKHLIPDLKDMFNETLFSSAEKNILSGFGFIDIAEATASSRKESILNPVMFIKETKQGVKDFKQLLNELVIRIKQRNPNNIKYMSKSMHITSSPVTAFMTKGFIELVRQQYDRGNLSKQTAIEVLGADYNTEKIRRENETKQGDDFLMYPPVTTNMEQHPDAPQKIEKPRDNELPDDKVNPVEKQNYDTSSMVRSACPYCGNVMEYAEELEKSEKNEWIDCIECGNPISAKDLRKYRTKRPLKDIDLEGAPYTRLKELPKNVRTRLTIKEQRKWLSIFNNAYDYKFKQTKDKKKAETYAFRVAWSRVNKKEAKIEKSKEITPLVEKTIDEKKLLENMKEMFIEHSQKLVDELKSNQEVEINKKKSSLLSNLLNKMKKDKNEDIQ